MSTTPSPVFEVLAALIDARARCAATGNSEWYARHSENIDTIVENFLPSGSGWDCGTKIDLGASTANCIVLYGEYHHMNDGGMYDGWTAHRVIVRPSLQFGFTLRITGRDRNEIKDYIHELFECALRERIAQSPEAPHDYRMVRA